MKNFEQKDDLLDLIQEKSPDLTEQAEALINMYKFGLYRGASAVCEKVVNSLDAAREWEKRREGDHIDGYESAAEIAKRNASNIHDRFLHGYMEDVLGMNPQSPIDDQ